MTGLTYWRCPEPCCRKRVGLHWSTTARINAGRCDRGLPPLRWEDVPLAMHEAERMVEAHEAKHLGGAA